MQASRFKQKLWSLKTRPPRVPTGCRLAEHSFGGAGVIFITMPSAYAEKLRDPRWQKKRLKIMARDQFCCRDCGAGEKTLNVHHCFYEKNAAPWEAGDDYLLTLCESCHLSRGELEHRAKRALAFILAHSANDPGDDGASYLAAVNAGLQSLAHEIGRDPTAQPVFVTLSSVEQFAASK